MSDTRQLYSADELEDMTARILRHWNVPEVDAATIARSLLAANLRGVDTHGVARIPAYIDRFRRGMVEPRPRSRSPPACRSRRRWTAATAWVRSWRRSAMNEALRRAETLGVGVATARRSNHFGTAAYLRPSGCGARLHRALPVSPASKSLAPFGSQEPLFGTNPIAAAAPAGRHAPWVMDMATSVAARGHIRLAARHGQEIPEGWALDSEGRPTTNAERALAGVMLPFSGVKGSAIAMLVDILGGVLSGSGFGGAIRDMTRDFEAPQDVGHFFHRLPDRGPDAARGVQRAHGGGDRAPQGAEARGGLRRGALPRRAGSAEGTRAPEIGRTA